MKKTTKILSLILALVMILSAIPVAVSAEECSHVDANKDHLCDDCSKELYVERSWSGLEKKELYTEVMVNKTLKEIPSNAAAITSETTTLEGGFYYVSGEVNVATRITVNGTAANPTCIILKDGCSFNAESGITVLADNVLYIYGQIRDSGTLTASGVEVKAAGIGGERDKTKLVCGTVTVFGGNVVAYGSTSSAGIGGSATTSGGAGGTVTVYGGTVEAYGGNWNNESGSTGTGAGIGGGLKAAGGSFTIYGGYVKAVSNAYGAGIGGGKGGAGGTFTMYDGEVFAYADNTESFLQPAIGNGGGSTTSSGTITVNCAYFAEAYYNFVQIQPPYSGEPWSSDTSDFAKYSYAHIKFAHNHDTVAEETTDNGDGTHSGKCICGESITTDEAHTFVDGFCTACGAADPSAPAHEHSFSKSWAKNETAHWHECTAKEDCDIEDYATCGIAEAAYGEHADADGNFYCDACNYFFAVAFYKEKFKADIKDNLLPAAVCDEAREILNKAYEDLDTAVTINDVQSIYNTAKGMSGGKNSDFTSKLNSYKSTITINLGDSPAAARDNFVENTINALENSQSIAELDKEFNNGTSQISYYKSTDANVNAFNNRINSGELSDKSIALAQEAIEKINEAKTYEEVSALSNKYHSKIDIQSAKEKASAELTAIAEEKNDSRVDAIVDEALAAIDEATAVMDINDIKAEAIAAIEALPAKPAGYVKKAVCEPGADVNRTITTTVECDAIKVQIINENGGTITFTRDDPRVSIQAYDADGNPVDAGSEDAAYEEWTLNQTLKAGNYTLIAKNRDGVWDSAENGCKLEIVDSDTEVEVLDIIAYVSAAKLNEKFDVQVLTGRDITKVAIQYNGHTYKTFTPTGKDRDGNNIFNCFAASGIKGDNTITVQYKTADGWQDCTDIYATVTVGDETTPRLPA